jgi:PhzF family phenazine biosynthesis protein
MSDSYPLYQVDAFTNKLFGGNPAAVVPLDAFLEDDVLLNIAIENNLSETAYCVPTEEEGKYDLRWFTPGGEVDLCGHATLATAWVLFNAIGVGSEVLHFNTHSGALTVQKLDDGRLLMDFPADHGKPIPLIDGLEEAIGCEVEVLMKGKDDFLAIVSSVEDLRRMDIDLSFVKRLGQRGLIVSASSDRVDFESRCFYPNYNIDEDPVTGSAHTLLTPYWSLRLNTNKLEAIQASPRQGQLTCIYKGSRVGLIGSGILYMKGEIYL